MHNYQNLYYLLAIFALLGTGAWGAVVQAFRVHRFFVKMDLTVTNISKNMDKIMDNHLPHIYERLGEKFEARQDKTSND